MQPFKIPVACLQVSAHDRHAFASAWPHVLHRVDEAGSRGAKLIVLPEGTVPGYVLGLEPVSPELLREAANDLSLRARRLGATIVYGAAKVVGDRTYNAAIAIGPDGRELGFAAKQFLWHFDRRWYAAGETLEPIASPIGSLGLLVCADGRIPGIAATLCDRGADVLVMPTAWVTSGRDPHVFENIQADYMAAVRARENGVPFVVANKVGVEGERVAYCGKSAIFASDGTTIARGSETGDEIVEGTIAIADRPRPTRATFALSGAAEQTAMKTRLRIAFTPRTSQNDVATASEHAREADADLLIAPSDGPTSASQTMSIAIARVAATDRVLEHASIRIGCLATETLGSPRALVAARLAGIDCFVWFAGDAPDWHVPLARTRAAELRAFVVVFVDRERSFVVDPDGAVVAGTFGRFALASFAYDPARTAATVVAPTTDVFAGLRLAETIASHARPTRDPA